MAWTLDEYMERLDARQDLLWPQPPPLEVPKATPYVKPLQGVRAVAWDVYGVLLRITDGQLIILHPQKLRMEVALEKTIKEFKMWHSMVRKPGAPWEYMLQQFRDVYEALALAGTKHKGDAPHVPCDRIWLRLIERLQEKKYTYDEANLGDLDEFSRKVAYFFQSSLQGIEPAPQALGILKKLHQAKVVQGVISDSQFFTPSQLLRALQRRGKLAALVPYLRPECIVFGHEQGVRKPSPSLYRVAAEQWKAAGFAPREVAYISCRVGNDLAVARQFGFRTVLYAGDKSSLQATASDVKDPERKPDRLITEFQQLVHVLNL